MKKIIFLLMMFPLFTYGENINLICKYDSTQDNEKFNLSFPLSIIQNKNGSHTILRNEKNIESLERTVVSRKLSDVIVSKSEISYRLYEVNVTNTSKEDNSGYVDQSTKISRIDGKIVETKYWKGGLTQMIFGDTFSNPIILTGTCNKRSSNKF